jgi:hypothetical protein
MLKKALRFGIALSACLVALRVGYYVLGIGFHDYDDEGYMLLSLKHYIAGGHLYTQVFTEYGPVFFFVQSFLFRLFHQSVTHDAGRHITLLLWIITCAAAAWFLYRISRSVLIVSATGLVMMLVVSFMSGEPNHPEHLALMVLTLACCASLEKTPTGFFFLGALGAALVLIKVNIGLFFFVALFAFFCCVLQSGLIRKIASIILLFYFIAGPVALMDRDLHTWASEYCALTLLCGVTTFVTALYTSPRFASVRSALGFAALGVVVLSVLVLIGLAFQKISLHSLLDGTLLTPMHHPQLYQSPLNVSLPAMLAIAVVVGGIITVYSVLRKRRRSLAWINLVRCLVAVCIVAAFMLWGHFVVVPAMLCLPLGLLPDASEWAASEYLPRLFVTLLAAAELLESYPVAGSQVIVSIAPLFLWSFICIYDGRRELERRFPQLSHTPGRLPAIGTLIAAVLVLCIEASVLKGGLWRMRFFTPASALRGSHSLHLDPAAEKLYVTLATSINRNCDMLYTLPGMGSLNLWSGEPTPNGMNLTAWVRFFRPEQQQEILRILQSDPNACAVANLRIESYWNPTSYNATSPLATYIVNDMPRAATLGDYEIHVNPQRTRPWLTDTYRNTPDN